MECQNCKHQKRMHYVLKDDGITELGEHINPSETGCVQCICREYAAAPVVEEPPQRAAVEPEVKKESWNPLTK